MKTRCFTPLTNMLRLPGYQTLAQICESDTSIVYRGCRTQDNQPVIFKILKEDYPTPEELARYRREYETIRNLNLEGIVKAYSLEKYQNTLIIILDDFGGESLNLLMNYRKFSLAEFLNVAIQTADIIGEIHKHNIIHKDINPSNIVLNLSTGLIKIIDFGISTGLFRENLTLRDPNVLEGTLAYMSPEQTGRMNRAMDYRTDFYSLGATFYEMLTHRLPFDSTDAMELVHCHIAKQPVPPHELNPEIPKTISDIVMKLLAKTAEDRYQSAYGIRVDLELCLSENFSLGSYDVSDKFQVSQKLYGREQEINTLLMTFERVSKGKSEMILVSGYSGVGKSALVNEIHKPVTRSRGYFIAGKFDQLQRNIPYASLIQAFQELIQQLLTESEAQIETWQAELLAALGVNGQVIIDVIPEIELIVGKQPPVPELGATESQNRFNLVFQNFISVFTKPEHPLVIFLDDLQWADSASLKLLHRLITEPDSKHLFIIGAYRDNEVNEAHPLMLTLEEIQKHTDGSQGTGISVNHIYLSPLSLTHINQLIVDTLNCEVERGKPLAELILQKTNGNPFFMNEFLKSLYAEKLIEFDFNPLMSFEHEEASKGKWQWNLEQIKVATITDNVVELMALKIQKLSEQTQQVLKLAACIGNQFDLQTLAIVNEKAQVETAAELWSAVQEGLILPIGDNYKLLMAQDDGEQREFSNAFSFYKSSQAVTYYKFLHDRVQQAAYSLIPCDRQQVVHLQVGKLLLKNTLLDKREEKVFDIVNQLNFGINLVTHQPERDELAELNLIAGKKAKASAAYEPALNYLRVGMEFLGADSWQQRYQLTLALYVEAAEAAYLSTKFGEMERLAEVVLQQARTPLDKVKVYECKVQAYAAQNQLLEAVKTALTILKLLGVRFPEKPRKLDILLSLVRTKLALAGKRIESLVNLPEMTDPGKLAVMRILQSVSFAVYVAVPELLPLIVFKQVNLSVKYGNASISAYAYASYGVILCGVLRDINSGYQFGQIALILMEQLNAKAIKANIIFLFNTFIKHWKQPLRETLKPLQEVYFIGLETGNLFYAASSTFVYSYNLFFIGKELTELEREMTTYSDAINKLGQETTLYMHKIYQQTIFNLLNKVDKPGYLLGNFYNEDKMLILHRETNNRTALYHLYINKSILCYMFHDYSRAVENITIAEKYLDSITALSLVAIFYFYDSLARLAVYNYVYKSEQKLILLKVVANQKKMKKWAHYAAMNYLHKFYLVEAEQLRVLGQDAKAMDCYDRAIELAKKNEYLNEEALAYELTAKFYLEKNKTIIAQAYMLNARYYYLRWGAVAKVKDLDARYPQLFSVKSDSVSEAITKQLVARSTGTRTGIAPIITSNSSSEALDLTTVIKASQILSSEIVLDKLLAKLMKILIENAGAQKGFLILETKGKLLIEAEGAVERENVTVLQSIPVEDKAAVALPEAIINYVARTKESVVLNDAAHEGKFTHDPYILETKPKSVLCAPLINQGQLISIVYLENNLTTAAFTSDRLKVLKLLSSQAAISIENAKLYSELRESESKLAQFLEAIPVGLAVIDASGKPYYTNRVAQQLLGKGVVSSATAEQIAEVYQNYIAGTDRQYPNNQLPIIRALRGENATADDIEIHHADKIIPIESWGTPIYDEKGKITYAIVAFQDVTERKKAEAERLKFTEKLFQLNEAFSRFVPRQFLQFLNKESIVDVKLGDHVQKEMSVLFADIRDFTTLSESMTPSDNFKFINAFLSRMEPAITEHNGFIDKYIGDAIMALFSGEADDAVKAAIAMREQLTKYNQHRVNSGYIPIQVGIGINTGSLMLGTVGGYNRMDGTVISDTVNLASRIEDLTKTYRVSLLISHQTFLRLQDSSRYAIRLVERVKVKGKSETGSVFEVFDGDPPEIRAAKLATLGIFEEALVLYNLQRFSEAEQILQDCLRQNPRDTVAQIYLARCQKLHSQENQIKN